MQIVIVEDEPVHARYLTKKLIDFLGEKVEQIVHKKSLSESLEHLTNNKVDLLFLDLNLYGDNGFEILKTIPTTLIPTIIVSANTNMALEAFEYGVLDFLSKPVEDERLLSALYRYATFRALYEKKQTSPFIFPINEEEKQYAKTRLQNINLEELHEQLRILMDENKIYKDENLSLEVLAKQLGIHSRQLSEYLNGKLKLSYISYIQKYRIDEARILLLKFPKMTVTDIGYNIGYKSLSSFYEAFREETGMTAGEFRYRDGQGHAEIPLPTSSSGQNP